MKNTVKLYENDAYKKEFSAEVLECSKKEDHYEVVLDQTAFFPEGGGQGADRGTLDEQQVQDVQVKNDIVYHTVLKPIAVGSTVSGKIDWELRFFNMQQHSGEHILSGIIHRKFGYDNVGFHMGSDVVTLDLNGPMTQQDIDDVEMETNQAIYENRKISILYPTKEELKTLDYRSKIEIKGQVRIVKIEGYDVCACCAPHVALTGEIGILKVVAWQKYKGGVRISILCGKRALEDFRSKQNMVAKISTDLSAKADTIVEAVEKLQKDMGVMKQEMGQLKEAAMNDKLSQLPDDLTNVCLFDTEIDAAVMRNAVNSLTEKYDGFCGVFSGNDADGYRYIIGSSKLNARELGNQLKEKFNARGGGSQAMIQGQLQAAQEEIKKLFA